VKALDATSTGAAESGALARLPRVYTARRHTLGSQPRAACAEFERRVAFDRDPGRPANLTEVATPLLTRPGFAMPLPRDPSAQADRPAVTWKNYPPLNRTHVADLFDECHRAYAGP